MPRCLFVSSLLRSAEYDEVSQTLHLVFVRSGGYRYFGVPNDVFTRLVEAKSKGTFFREHIASRYEFEQVPEPRTPGPE